MPSTFINNTLTPGRIAAIRLVTRALLITLFLAPVGPVWGQSSAPQSDQGREKGEAQPSTTLTVQDVIKLVQAGLPDDLIIAKIRRNNKPYDLSADEILNLKNAGVSANVLKAMIEPQVQAPAPQTGGPTTSAPAQGAAPSGVPDEVGVYWAEHSSMLHRIEGLAVSNMRTGSTLASGMTLGLKRARINAQLRGARAQLRIKERQPEFYNGPLF